MHFHEQPFTIDGIKSWIHCLDRHVDPDMDECPNIPHDHDYIEFLYATNADAIVQINDEFFEFKTGDLAVISSEEPHTLSFNSKSDYICVKFLPEILYSDTRSVFEYRYVLPFFTKNLRQRIFHKNEINQLDIKSLISEIMQEWEDGKTGYEFIIRANILKVFSLVIRHWEKNDLISFNINPSDTIKKALSFIGENYSTITESDVAAHCGVSRNHFSFMFKNTMGKNFKNYVTFLKIHNAEKMLITTDKSITDIAFETGFSSSSHFISCFKKQNDVTPKQFRNRVAKKQ